MTPAPAVGRMLLLSAYHPAEPECAALSAASATAAYELEYRDGFAHPGRPLLFVREGAVLPAAGAAVMGTCPTVSAADAATPSRCYGYAYGIGAG
jgi:hypothetical protein